MRFTNKVAIITGGASGIGRGISRAFVRAGGKVLMCGIDGPAGPALAAELSREGPGAATWVDADLRNEHTIAKLVASTIKHYGKIDTVVNNAGYHPPLCAIDEQSTDDMRDVLAVNLIAPWLLCKLAMPHLRATKGSVVNVASVSGYFGQVGSSAYCASKAGLVGFSKSLAIDEAQHGVRINCVSPGNIWTAAWEKQAAGNAAAIAEGSNSQLLGRFGTPDEVGEVVLHLATATFTTGTEYLCTGGAEIGYGLKGTEPLR